MSTTTSDRRVLIAILILAPLALSLAAAGDGTLPGDVRLARWVRANPIPFAVPLTGFTNDYVSGLPLSIAGHAVAALLLLRHRPGPALLITLATWLRLTNGLLKLAVDSPRPTPDLVAVTERATGLGFPSGHAMGAALLLGAVAWLVVFPSFEWGRSRPSFPPLPGGEGPGVRVLAGSSPSEAHAQARAKTTLLRRVAALACLAVILLTGYGRILVGAHWPSDVLGGYLWGGLLLAAAASISRRLRAGPGARPRP